MNIYNSVSALSILSLTSGSTTSLDLSSLGDYYSAKSTLANTSSSSSTTSGVSTVTDTVTVPPWDETKDTKTDSAKLVDALQTTNFIQTTGNYFNTSDVSDDLKKLYTAYLALSKLQAIAAKAADDSTVSATLNGLDKTFQKGLSQVYDYLDSQTFDQLTLIEGEKRPSTKTTLAVPRNLVSQYTTGVLVKGNYDDPLNLTGTETFNVAVKKNGVTTNVAIDLSNVTGPLTLDNVASYINDQLAANNVVTRFARNKIADGEFGFVVNGVETESVSFSATSATPTVYVAGVSGSGTDAAGQLVRVDDNGTSGSVDFAARIEASSGSTSTEVTSTDEYGKATTSTVTTPILAPATANATAVDADGNIFVVGTTQGTLDGQTIKGTQDAYLTKYDSTGKLLWTRLIGASSSAEGFAVATDSKGNVVIAGRADTELTGGSVGGGEDSFVTKFNADGEEVFTYQISPLSDDGATALTIGPDDSIYVGGYAKSAITSGTTYSGGGGDATVTKLTSAGKRVWSREFGTSGADTTRSLAIASDGNLLVATVENDHAVLRKFDASSGTSSALWTVDLGALNGGSVGAIAVDGSAVYVGGATSNASLDAGGTASIVQASSGGLDGFITRIDDAGASASANFTSYIGTSTNDAVRGLAAAGGAVYVTGDTYGTLPGETKSGTLNGFVAKLDSSGITQWNEQYSGRNGVASGKALAIDTQGASTLDALGLPRGTIEYNDSQLLTANSSLRVGDYFEISVNGKTATRITIKASDTMRSLTTRLNALLLTSGKAITLSSSTGYQLMVSANAGNSITFSAGKEGSDALQSLGLRADTIVNESKPKTTVTTDTPATTIEPADLTPLNNYVALGLDVGIDLSTKTDAAKALNEIEAAMRNIRLAYDTLTNGKFVAGTGKYANSSSSSQGQVPAYLQAQIANYTAGLQRLTGGSTTTSLF